MLRRSLAIFSIAIAAVVGCSGDDDGMDAAVDSGGRDTGTDAFVPPADTGTDAPPVADSGPDAPMPGCGAGEWYDPTAESCRTCPADAVDCSQLIGPPDPVFDPATGVLTVQVPPSAAEIVSGTWSARVDSVDGMGMFMTETASGTLGVDENVLTADLGAATTATTGDYRYVNTDIVLTDRCGTTSTIDDLTPEGGLGFDLEPADGGPPAISYRCLRD
jgi:hypothetical protein